MKTTLRGTRRRTGGAAAWGCWLLAMATALPANALTAADTLRRETRFDENNGLSQAHATQILQTDEGFLWIATWNGLNRFDGYEFRRMASQAGDGCTMGTDRLRDIWLTDEGDIYCMVDEGVFLFDTKTYRFRDLDGDGEQQRALDARQHAKGRAHSNGTCLEFSDRQGQQWQMRGDAIYRLTPYALPAKPLAQVLPTATRCLARDAKGRIWVATKDDATVRLYDSRLNAMGYVAADGRIVQTYTSFGTPVYCISQTADGTVWMGSKPGGLFRLTENGAGFGVTHVAGLPASDVYDIKEDRWHRLWLATLGGGLICYEPDGGGAATQFLSPLKVRFIHLTADDVLLATTTDGLVTARLLPELKNMRFHRHTKEPDRENSLSCNATMDVVQDRQGRLYVSTESGGVCRIESTDLTAPKLDFSRLDMKGGWPTNVALSLTDMGRRLLVTSSNQLVVYDKEQQTGVAYDATFFNHPYRFSEVHPLLLDDGRWLLGSMEGAFTLSPADIRRSAYVPPLVLTGISVQGNDDNLAVNHLDSLLLAPTERSVTIHFAALDYTAPQHISYAYRLRDDAKDWTSLGHDRSVTLLDLKPGTYRLALRSTNADGVWTDNIRTLTIVVRPTFWETPWATLLISLIVAAVVFAIARTIIYIRHIKLQRQDMLEKYLALLEEHAAQPAPGSTDTPTQPGAKPDDAQPEAATDPEADAFMKRVVAFVEQHIGDADINIGDMADAAAVSRSGLQRKMKQLLGVTPLDFLREARIKRACQLLRQTDAPISDVAYQCGFSDPKYFSRSFKQSMGCSPSDYREKAMP